MVDALSPEPDDPSEACVGGRRWGLKNPGVKELLSVVDETQELVRSGHDLGGC